MSKLNEYIKLGLKGIKNIDHITMALVTDVQMKYGHLNQEKRDEIIRRRMICKSCPFMSKNATTSEEYLSLTGKHYSSDREAEHCAFCGCPTEIRTAALDKECGGSTWNEENPDKQIELKWTEFK